MNREIFFNKIRPMFAGGKLTEKQVQGTSYILDTWEEYYSNDPINWLAYNLATAFHETGGRMQPVFERGRKSYFNKYEPNTRIGKVLGNTTKGDGWRYRGAGLPQNTGRANAHKATKRLNEVFDLGVDLVKNPDQRNDPFVSAHSLILGSKEGWWTGKALSDYIDDVDDADEIDYKEYLVARWVVNGKDKRVKIAGYAIRFENALRAGLQADVNHSASDAPDKPVTLLGRMLSAIVAILKLFFERK